MIRPIQNLEAPVIIPLVLYLLFLVDIDSDPCKCCIIVTFALTTFLLRILMALLTNIAIVIV